MITVDLIVPPGGETEVLPGMMIRHIAAGNVRARVETDMLPLHGTAEPMAMVPISQELLAELGEWSKPVQIRVVRTGNTWDMQVREPEQAAQPVQLSTSTSDSGLA